MRRSPGDERRLEDPKAKPRNDKDARPQSRRDRDRIFYSTEFGRLEGVTQIATVLASSVHNRLTHSYRVEQIARSMALHLLADGLSPDLVSEDVVAAAALAHDLGHPPFGHTGETALQRAVSCDRHRRDQTTTAAMRATRRGEEMACAEGQRCLLPDGFEGNAQTFRILTLLADKNGVDKEGIKVLQAPTQGGMDLTRRVLSASLKYPWLRGGNRKKLRKWGAYDADAEAFAWVVASQPSSRPNLEAQIMDFADDIAYAVHDLEDFHKAGIIPLDQIKFDKPGFAQILLYARGEATKIGLSPEGPLAPLDDEYRRWREERSSQLNSVIEDEYAAGASTEPDRHRYPILHGFKTILDRFPDSQHTDDLDGRRRLTRWRSNLITQLLDNIHVSRGRLGYRKEAPRMVMEYLKQVTWYYVIDKPKFIAIRRGQSKLVAETFEELHAVATRTWLNDLGDYREPTSHELLGVEPLLADFVDLGRLQSRQSRPSEVIARAVVDFICTMGDSEIYDYGLKLRGAPTHASAFVF